MNPPVERLSIAIVGAGIGGLSLALRLQQHGIHDVQVFERSRQLSSRGGTIRLNADAQDALAKLGVLAEVDDIGIRNTRFDTLSNGRLVSRTHYGLISISREALQKILARNVSRSVLHFGRNVTSVAETATGVELFFTDGETRSFDLIIGADGIFSAVSQSLFPLSDEAAFSGLVVYYCIAKGSFLPEPVHTEHFISRRDVGFRQVTVAGGGSDGRWDSLQITTRGPPSPSEWANEGSTDDMRAYLALAGEDCLPGAHAIVENADRVFKWGMYQSPERTSWIAKGGRAVLLGDAAHAMAPFTAQGAGSAIEDGLDLGVRLSSESLFAALRHYETHRKPACEHAIEQAGRRGMYITAHGATRQFTDLMTRSISTGLAQRHPGLKTLLRRALVAGSVQTEKLDALIDRARPTQSKRPITPQTD